MNYRNKIFCFFPQIIGNVMDDSSGAKEDENVMHKVGIRLGKCSMIDGRTN
jgi:hypothetical protein